MGCWVGWMTEGKGGRGVVVAGEWWKIMSWCSSVEN